MFPTGSEMGERGILMSSLMRLQLKDPEDSATSTQTPEQGWCASRVSRDAEVRESQSYALLEGLNSRSSSLGPTLYILKPSP